MSIDVQGYTPCHMAVTAGDRRLQALRVRTLLANPERRSDISSRPIADIYLYYP
jgi:hypothetical protein